MLNALIVAAGEGEAPNPLLPAWYDIVYSIIPFALVLLLFWRVVLPRMQTMLDERAAKIEGGIAQAESAQEEAKAALDKYNAMLAEARVEAPSIREQARAEGATIIAELKEQAAAEADRITKNAQAQIEAERQSALVSLRAEVGSLALDLASGVIGASLTDDARSTALVDRFLSDLESAESTKAAK
jgi:F-type H+-transporting ATPase subunit b